MRPMSSCCLFIKEAIWAQPSLTFRSEVNEEATVARPCCASSDPCPELTRLLNASWRMPSPVTGKNSPFSSSFSPTSKTGGDNPSADRSLCMVNTRSHLKKNDPDPPGPRPRGWEGVFLTLPAFIHTMRVGFFTDTYFPQVNGVTFTLEAWRKGLEERGHEVEIYYPSGDYRPGLREHPFRSTTLWFYPDYRVALPIRVPNGTEKLDIIHQHGLYGMALAGLNAARAHHTPKLQTFHTPGDEYLDYLPGSRLLKPAMKRAYLAYERWLLNSYGHVTTGSPVIRDRLLANGVRDVEVLSNGLDMGLFYRVDPGPFRERNGISSEKVIGFCGRLGFEKHVEDLINAADGFDGTVLIAGSGPAETYYRKLAAGKKNVKVLGFLPRDGLREFYSALDVFVFPSFCETQGLVALESMACGVPVVGVPVLALKSTIEDGRTGYHYAPGNTKELLEKVGDCYANAANLRAGCLAEAKRNSVSATVDRLEEIYRGLAR